MHKIIAGFLTALVCACAHAQVYKWVDSKGVTHYDEKPPDNLKSKEIQLHGTVPSAGAAPAAGDAGWQDKERAFKQRQVQRDKTAATEESDRQKSEALAAKCKSVKTGIENMRNARRVFDTDDKGERQYLDDDQRATRIAQHEAEYNQECN